MPRYARSKKAIVDEQTVDIIEQQREVALQKPGLAGGSVSIRRRVEDHAVVSATPPDLSRDERPGVVDQPTDRSVLEAVPCRVPPAQSTEGFEASTWATDAPASASASVTRPV